MLSLIWMGLGSFARMLDMAPTLMWLPNPMTLSRMVCLNPNTTERDMMMTESPMATAATAMRMAGRLTCCC